MDGRLPRASDSEDAIVPAHRGRRRLRRVRGRRRRASPEPAWRRPWRLGADPDRQRNRLRRADDPACWRELYDDRNQGQFRPPDHRRIRGGCAPKGGSSAAAGASSPATVRIIDARGRILAHGASTLMVLAGDGSAGRVGRTEPANFSAEESCYPCANCDRIRAPRRADEKDVLLFFAANH